jgi:lipoate-protein ligase A
VSREELEKHLVEAFRTVLGWDLEPATLSPEEVALADKLEVERYGDGRWTMERGRQQEELY